MENEKPPCYGPTVINGLSAARVCSPMPDTFLRSSTVLNGPCSWRYWVIALAFVGPIPFKDVSCASSAVLILTRAALPGTAPIPALPCSAAVPAFPGIELVPDMLCAKTTPAPIRCTTRVTMISHCIRRHIGFPFSFVSRKARRLTRKTLAMHPSCHPFWPLKAIASRQQVHGIVCLCISGRGCCGKHLLAYRAPLAGGQAKSLVLTCISRVA